MMNLITHSTGIRSATLSESTLPKISEDLLCSDHIYDICRKGDLCQKSHQLCLLVDETPSIPTLESGCNELSILPRLRPIPFEHDGPGSLSKLGPRHDNDHVDFQHIRILPTADEILSQRPPYMPSRDFQSTHRLPLGPSRLLDINFRQLRHENVENLIDCCYHASQQLSQSEGRANPTDYSERRRTPKGSHYSLFRDIAFEELSFHDHKGMLLRVSFACPVGLRGQRMGLSRHFEKGMLVALIGLSSGACLSVTFMEIHQRQSSEAMKRRTGNDSRASVILSFAEPMDTCAARRLLYNFAGMINETFTLVELPGVLFAGFRWTLHELQQEASSARVMAFGSTIAPSSAFDSPIVLPPEYAMHDDFNFELDILRPDHGQQLDRPPLTLKPANVGSDQASVQKLIGQVCDQTSLDHGQATALCESLCRSLAFTQGPPGTGKTFLGVALARVLLASRLPEKRRPILVVCLTNHALDSFLKGLCEAGIAGLVRFGGNSKEDWTKPFQKQNVTKRFKKQRHERAQVTSAKDAADTHGTECRSWCEALNNDALSWPAVREYLQVKDPSILTQFTSVEKSGSLTISDIRLARKAGGFAFEFWCQGGDIKDVDLLLKTFNTFLGVDSKTSDSDWRISAERKDRVIDNIRWNIAEIEEKQINANTDIWKLPLYRREELFRQWKHEIGLQTILDRTAESHRRHQDAIAQKRKIHEDIDVRMLENVDVIAMTTTACAMHRSLLEKLDLQIVMCEEAGEVMEAHFLCTLLPSVSHYISIGDPLQLRPQVNEQSLSLETTQGSTYRLDESLMERLMLPKRPEIFPIESSTLDIQRRMHPEIADLMRVTLYPYLKDHESTRDDRGVYGLVDRVWWLDHQVPEDGYDENVDNPTSCSNAFEIEMIAGFVHYLIESNEYDSKDITVLTPYNGQLAALTHKLKGIYSLWLSEKDRETLCQEGLIDTRDMKSNARTEVDVADMLRLATVDNFQGEESKIVILSAVRSNESGRVGFMKTMNRINVACSRARNGFYIIGNATLMQSVPMWHQIASLLASKAKIGSSIRICCQRHPETIHHITKPEEWYETTPCQRPCDFIFPCGHKCNMACHAPSLHDRMGCTKPCMKVLEECGHQCPKLCNEPCGDCTYQQVLIQLACGHDTMLSCAKIGDNETVTDVLCNIKVATKELPCGHEKDVLCSEQDALSPCMENCGMLLTCGHFCEGPCSICVQTSRHQVCEAICNKKYRDCEHEYLSKCHPKAACPPCKQPCMNYCMHGKCPKFCGGACENCMKPCDWICEHEGACSSLCCLPCDRFPCWERCDKVLACGHRCSSLCGEACSAFCIQCQPGCVSERLHMFLPCGHHFEVKELDSHVGIQKIYEVNEHGKILRMKDSAGDVKINATCPICEQSCSSTRRYGLQAQLQAFPHVLDGIHSRLCRKFGEFLDLIFSTKLNLGSSFKAFQECLKPGPLNGRKNEVRIRERSSMLYDLQMAITRFKDETVSPFESTTASLARFLPKNSAFCTSTMSARLRLETISRRCKLIILEDRIRCIEVLETFAEQSSHTPLLIKALQAMTITEAKEELSLLDAIAEECELKNLKRLACEVQVIWTCVQLVLRKFELRVNEIKIQQRQRLQKARDLCQQFPDTAGLLLPICLNVQRAVDSGCKDAPTFYAWEFKGVFWSWPRHQIGALKTCPNRHFYSGLTWTGCPECGREVKTPENQSPKPLNTGAFILAMKSSQTTFDKNAYRRKPLNESKNLVNGLLTQNGIANSTT